MPSYKRVLRKYEEYHALIEKHIDSPLLHPMPQYLQVELHDPACAAIYDLAVSVCNSQDPRLRPGTSPVLRERLRDIAAAINKPKPVESGSVIVIPKEQQSTAEAIRAAQVGHEQKQLIQTPGAGENS